MNWGDKTAAVFRLDEEGWERHANPWSVITRATVYPVLILAIWSRVWLGWWCLAPVALALFWGWINPRLFSAPKNPDNWASKAVYGERLWLKRDREPIPRHHRVLPLVLGGIAGLGSLFILWGLIALDPWPTGMGLILTYAGKFWFLDRMVWLYEDLTPK